MQLRTPSSPATHVSFYSPKGGQGVSTTAAAVALFCARLGAQVTLRSHDVAAMAALLAVPSGDNALEVNGATELLGLDVPPRSSVVVDDAGGFDAAAHAGASPTRILVLRPCYLALKAAIAALREQRPPDSLVVVAEPDRALGPNDLADALGVPVAAVVPVDPAVARAVDAGLLGAFERPRTPLPLEPLLDLAGRLLAIGDALPPPASVRRVSLPRA